MNDFARQDNKSNAFPPEAHEEDYVHRQKYVEIGKNDDQSEYDFFELVNRLEECIYCKGIDNDDGWQADEDNWEEWAKNTEELARIIHQTA
ncbi:MAG: hypothetical protein L3J67_13180 [Hyphomicrobiaceae bacterium]|nr:hypothetical protein [Hyphomicrobiaceae bacterium]